MSQEEIDATIKEWELRFFPRIAYLLWQSLSFAGVSNPEVRITYGDKYVDGSVEFGQWAITIGHPVPYKAGLSGKEYIRCPFVVNYSWYTHGSYHNPPDGGYDEVFSSFDMNVAIQDILKRYMVECFGAATEALNYGDMD